MATLDRRVTDRGVWIAVRSEDGVHTLSAHSADEREETHLTLYWRGRTDFDRLEGFFGSSLPSAPALQVNALAYTADARRRLEEMRSGDEIRKNLPADTRFLRLECLTRREEDQPFEASFIVWSRLDLSSIRPGDPAPDEIGAFLAPSHLPKIGENIISFVADTHIAKLSQERISDGLSALSTYLRTRASTPDRPRPATA